MTTKTSILISFVLIAAAIIVGVLLSAQLPDPMPSHWNAAGEVDGYTSKFLGIWLLPLMTAGILLLLAFLPMLDPLRANIEKFRGLYNAFLLGFTVYMLYVYGLTLAAALGWQFNMTYMLVPVVGLLFVGISFLLQNAKRNFFIGIRTPWTLVSDSVWDKTHQLGAQTFRIAGVLVIISAFFGENGLWLLMVSLLFAALLPVVYSYFAWRQEQSETGK
ncbi:MAG: SdpI family protein [Anaerolineales bacterium]|nr:SdpI family protein [Anaerolineales bacterium]